MEKKGRPKIDIYHVFNNEKYMWIIFLIYNCEKFKCQPQLVHLKYALADRLKAKNYDFKVLKRFFDIKPISVDNETMVDNLQYYALVTWESKYRGIKKGKEYRDIISLTSDYIKTFLELKYNKEFTEKKIDFERLIDKLNNLKKLKKPFKNWNDLWKYMNNLRELDLIKTDNKKRNSSYRPTEKCKKILYKLHIEHLKDIMTQKIETAHYSQIEKNYFDFMNLF